MKLRRRLWATVASLSLATLGGSFLAVYLANNDVQERQLDTALVREAREEAREAAQAGGERLMISARPGPQYNDVGPLTKYAAIYAPDGRVVATTATFAAGPPAFGKLVRNGLPFDMWYGAQHLRGMVVRIPAAPHTSLLLAATRADLDDDEAFLARAMLVVFGFAFAWVLLISLWVVRRFTSGHETIANVVRAVASGELSARVRLDESDEEVAQLARDVNHMIAQLGALMMSHQLFVANAAHELRSPLTSLYGELSHALRRSREAEAYRSAIEEALDSTKRLMALAEDLLALARLSEAGDEEYELVELRVVVERAVKWTRAEALQRQVEFEIAELHGFLRGRPLDLERLFRNLLENAVRYSPVAATVKVQALLGSEHVVTISNRSAPIPEADRQRLFEPFCRGAYANAEDRPGAGLGLPIARQIAWAHGGSIEWAAAGEGLVAFQVTLPREVTPVRTLTDLAGRQF